MTNEEAIRIIKSYDGYFVGHSTDEVNEALDMANEALEKQKVGEWIELEDKILAPYKCSRCGIRTNHRTRYCPECGAEMKKEKAYEQS